MQILPVKSFIYGISLRNNKNNYVTVVVKKIYLSFNTKKYVLSTFSKKFVWKSAWV